MGRWSPFMFLFFSRICPSGTRAVPNRAVRVGNTESYMSAPRAEQMTTSSGWPTPMTYRGLWAGRRAVHCATTLQKSSLDSPPARPPMAYPGRCASRAMSPSRLRSRSRGLSPPCTMAKRFCASGREWAAMHRSIQRVVRWHASSTRGPVVRLDTTSSSAMMTSAPSRFCTAMLASGVSSMRRPFLGFWNRTPSSVMSARCSSDTIWKPPESVSIGRRHPVKLCRPPSSSTSSLPGLDSRW
mmetsp:Transcript_35980/g.101294  ORF Transcript_35980/g.101294 Transcript_35980/m.101294 type:complete len:241 (+) Transcript_35980:299-1021(+)